MFFTRNGLLLLLALSATLFSLASAAPRLTNGERMRRGMPLNAPVRRDPTRTRRSQPSGTPPKTFTGRIKVSSIANHNTIGFMQLSDAKDRAIVGGANSASHFTFVEGSGQAITCDDCNGKNFGLAVSPGVILSPSNSNAAIVSPQGGIPGAQYETNVWTYLDTPTKPVDVYWTNSDGSQPTESYVWDPIGETLYVTANPAAVILNHPGAQTVEFMLVG
ncbi:hypothetical protein DL96DRAFT_1818257 [Flagelloscypha sp. PMI_526]|nr:hypothetical protein DL96DRAFT_1818257 [Flagelloscypha sp. PMI_526]